MELGAKLKNLRLDRGISTYHVSKVSGIAQNHISAIENGKVKPRVDTIEKILNVLGCTLAEFFNEDPETYYLSPAEKTILSQFRTLTEEQQTTLGDLISMVFRTCRQ